MKRKSILMVSDSNELVNQFKTEVKNALHSEIQVLQKLQKHNSVEYLTRADVAERLHISFSTLNRLIKNSGLKAFKCGRRTLFRSTDVEAVLIQLNTKGEMNYEY
jgi:excisionase family DNA binding protein